MGRFRELWQVRATGPTDDPVTFFAGTPSVGRVAPVAVAAFTDLTAIESRVIRLRRPLGVQIGASSLFVDRATGRTWRVNEIAAVGRRRFWDVSLTTYVPSSSVVAPDVTASMPPQAGWLVGFQEASPAGVVLRSSIVYVTRLFSFGGTIAPATGGDWTWLLRPNSVTGDPGLQLPRDANGGLDRFGDPALRASGTISNPIWVGLPNPAGNQDGLYQRWSARFDWGGDGYTGEQVIPQAVDGLRDNLRMQIRRRDQSEADLLQGFPPVTLDTDDAILILTGSSLPGG